MSSDSVKTLKVGDFAKVKGGKRMPAGTALSVHKSRHPYLRIVDFKDGGIDKSILQYVPDEVFPQIARYVISDRDLYISIVGTIGLVGAVPKDLDGANLTENAAKICEIDESRVCGKYLGYFLRSAVGQAAIQSLTVGSTQPKLALFRIDQIEVPCPPLDDQKTIAALLTALDDRITLLRETNATLEAIAQALFKSWFVDFDPVRAKMEGRAPEGMDEATAALFPDGFEESELGLVPTGWRVMPVGDAVHAVGGATPDTKNLSFWGPAIHCWTTPKDLSGIAAPVLLDTERKLSDLGLAKIGSGLLPVGTLLLSSRAPIGYLAIAYVPLATNQGYIAMPPGALLPPLYLMFWCRQNMEIIKGRANGSTFMEISKKAFRPIPTLVPSSGAVNAFADVAEALFDRLVENEKQAQTLSTLRDTLLPRLISGQLRLPEAQAAMEQAPV
jgi:type I restriction enzyme S subunit